MILDARFAMHVIFRLSSPHSALKISLLLEDTGDTSSAAHSAREKGYGYPKP